MPAYSISRREGAPPADGTWRSGYWSRVRPLAVARFHPHSSRHHPAVTAKVVHTSRALHILFEVHDRFVVCEKTEMHQMVCQDSCVEAFLQPRADKGYFNFEINCGGTLLLYYVEDCNSIGPTGTGYKRILPEEAAKIRLTPSLKEVKPYRLTGPLTWSMQASIPVEVMEAYIGPMDGLEGQWWRGNFFKCADYSKYQHWASWASVGAPLRFHQPARYGELYFRSRVEGE